MVREALSDSKQAGAWNRISEPAKNAPATYSLAGPAGGKGAESLPVQEAPESEKMKVSVGNSGPSEQRKFLDEDLKNQLYLGNRCGMGAVE